MRCLQQHVTLLACHYVKGAVHHRSLKFISLFCHILVHITCDALLLALIGLQVCKAVRLHLLPGTVLVTFCLVMDAASP